MKAGWTEIALGEVCRFEKGTSPTLKTEPGPYPLVVTAGYRRSSIDYQFNQPAVCIPLVSSTGHGNAAIHRIHYQEGKFALANLLVAVIPFDESQLNPKFLWRYLSAMKDKKLVPLMQGTANVSLKEKDILDVTVPLLPMVKQQLIVAHLDAIEERLNRINQLRVEQEQELQAALRSAFNKVLSKAKWIEMGEVAPLQRRQIEIEPDGKYLELGARSFGRGIFHKPTLQGSDLTWQKLFRVYSGDIVLSNIKAWEGAIALAGEADHNRCGSHRYLTCVVDSNQALPEIVCFYLLTNDGLEKIGKASPGSADRNRTLSLKRLEEITVPIPPMEIQQEFKSLLELRNKIQVAQQKSHRHLDVLLHSILDRVFND